jgi:tryptophan-rich sensory protein
MNVTKSFQIGRLRSPLALLLAFLICFAAARLGSIATVPNLDWYGTLAKPGFTPPNWLFPVACTILFALMAIALWRIVMVSGGWIARNRTLIPFAVQLVLNVLWSFAFFGNHSPAEGFAVIVLLIAAIVWTMIAFRRKDQIAAWLLAPYLIWVVYAAVLNAAIWRLNM